MELESERGAGAPEQQGGRRRDALSQSPGAKDAANGRTVWQEVADESINQGTTRSGALCGQYGPNGG